MAPRQTPIDKLANAPQFKSFMKTLAVVGGVLFVAGIVMKLSGVQKGETLLITGAGTLSIVSFFLGRLFPCPFHVYPAHSFQETPSAAQAEVSFSLTANCMDG